MYLCFYSFSQFRQKNVHYELSRLVLQVVVLNVIIFIELTLRETNIVGLLHTEFVYMTFIVHVMS
jgi:hypothetical protein